MTLQWKTLFFWSAIPPSEMPCMFQHSVQSIYTSLYQEMHMNKVRLIERAPTFHGQEGLPAEASLPLSLFEAVYACTVDLEILALNIFFV